MLAEGAVPGTGTKRGRLAAAATVTTVVLLLWGAGIARAATTWTVASSNDDAGTASCNASTHTCPSLRDAVNNSSPGDTVKVPAGTYKLAVSFGELQVNHDLTIVGAGANLVTINGSDTSRVFEITSGVRATISGVTATHGFSEAEFGGGAILVEGTLTLLNSTVSDSVSPTGGGGIADFGTLILSGSTITGNSAPSSDANPVGGGIEVARFSSPPSAKVSAVSSTSTPIATITNSTITGNSAGAGSGNFVGGEGGGVYVRGTLTATNVTIASNTAYPFPTDAKAAGDASFSSGANVFGETTGGGGFENTIIADPKLSPNCGTGEGVLPPSEGHNLEDDSAKTCGFTQSTDKTGVDPKLGPLANNGGPTQTLALLIGSPAIDAGATIASITTDQRGVHRPQGKAYDIGAYEFVPPTSKASSPSADMGITDPVTVGHTVTYTLKATNHGPDAAANVKVTDRLPRGVSFESVSTSKGSCSRSGRTITCGLGSVKVGQTVTIKVTVRPEKAGTITNRARVASTTPDPNKSNNKASRSTQVEAVTKPKAVTKPPFTG